MRTSNVILAVPPLFLLHEAEEYLTMLPWIAEHLSIIPPIVRAVVPDSPLFLAYAGIFFLVIYAVAGVVAIRSAPATAPWFILGMLLAARLENAILHCFESIALMMYTPGVITALLIVLPITAYLLITLTRQGLLRKRWIPGLFVTGFVAHSVAVAAMLLVGSR